MLILLVLFVPHQIYAALTPYQQLTIKNTQKELKEFINSIYDYIDSVILPKQYTNTKFNLELYKLAGDSTPAMLDLKLINQPNPEKLYSHIISIGKQSIYAQDMIDDLDHKLAFFETKLILSFKKLLDIVDKKYIQKYIDTIKEQNNDFAPATNIDNFYSIFKDQTLIDVNQIIKNTKINNINDLSKILETIPRLDRSITLAKKYCSFSEFSEKEQLRCFSNTLSIFAQIDLITYLLKTQYTISYITSQFSEAIVSNFKKGSEHGKAYKENLIKLLNLQKSQIKTMSIYNQMIVSIYLQINDLSDAKSEINNIQ